MDFQAFAPFIPAIITIVVIVVIAVVVNTIVKSIKRSIRQVTNRATSRIGQNLTNSLLSTVVEQTNTAATETPLSLSNLESVHLPKIRTAYPELNIEDLRNTAGTTLKEYLDSVAAQSSTDAFSQLAAQSLCGTVRHLSGQKYANKPFVLHKAVVEGFSNGKIRFELAYKTDKQRRATVEFAYMKEKENETADADLEKKCSNCGAILTKEAQNSGHCLFCDQVFKVVNEYEWLAVNIIILA